MILTIKLCLTMYLAVGQNNGQIDDQLPKQTTKHFTCEKSGHLNIWLVIDYGLSSIWSGFSDRFRQVI